MTGPASLDYPDWTRTFAAARDLILADAATITVSKVYPAVAVGNINSLAVIINATTRNTRYTFDWFLDQALGTQISEDQIDVLAGCLWDQTITPAGAYLRLTVTPFGGAATYDIELAEAPTPRVAQVGPDDNILINLDTSSINATTTLTDLATKIVAGWAYIQVWTQNATTWEALLSCVSSDGNVDPICHVNQTSPHAPFLIFIPACQLQLQVTNHDAAARTFSAIIMHKPIIP